ncbi:sigma-70 family RNA polymerase sigma factor [Micromonospora sp. WMMD1102]|uniref:RNA polymerase sigma factor n=1 Tax=Micromonospora sp. WMMD1102 TaxID=3016105 RepID=UPI002414E6ED|nr:sigma-70 family RNA polymerase sigma factor [Micromonospora sp. WMMD1102]MDG4791797.1 sigma-70 family RNA polymerase sigma factor [Micromonospora sp. WMMD1102]
MRTDIELLVASDHDAHAFRELYDRYAKVIHGFFRRRTGEHETALDLTAETFAQVWQARHRFVDRHAGSLGPWLFGIARNLLLRAVRNRRVLAEATARLGMRVERAVVTPDESWLNELDADLESALASLPAAQRSAVGLRVLHDRSYEDIGDALDCSPGAARIRVSRGLTALRGRLRPTRPTQTRRAS